jgi:hypothetical protein
MSEYNGRDGNGYQPLPLSATDPSLRNPGPPSAPLMRNPVDGGERVFALVMYTGVVFAFAFGLGLIAAAS